MPLLKVCKESPSVIPGAVQGIGFLPPKHATWAPNAATATMQLTLLHGQACHVVLWLLNGGLSVGWASMTCGGPDAMTRGDASVAAASTPQQQAQLPTTTVTSTGTALMTSGAFKPRAKLLDTDPVAMGEETLPPLPLPVPFRTHTSSQRQLPETCVDDSSGVRVRVLQAVGVGGGVAEPAVVPADGMMCCVLSISAPPVANAATVSAIERSTVPLPFDLELQYSSDVYSPYVMKLNASLIISMLPGPFIASMEPFAAVCVRRPSPCII